MAAAAARQHLADTSHKLGLAVSEFHAIDKAVASLTAGVDDHSLSEAAVSVQQAASIAKNRAAGVLKAAEAAEAAASKAAKIVAEAQAAKATASKKAAEAAARAEQVATQAAQAAEAARVAAEAETAAAAALDMTMAPSALASNMYVPGYHFRVDLARKFDQNLLS